MKFLLFLLTVSATYASTQVDCVNKERGYAVQVDLYEETADISFVHNGRIYKSYSQTPYKTRFRNVIFSSTDKLVYEFEFLEEKVTYLTIERDSYKGNVLDSADGVFLPRNNVFWPDAELECSFQ